MSNEKKANRSNWVWSYMYNKGMAQYGSIWAATQYAREAVIAYHNKRAEGK